MALYLPDIVKDVVTRVDAFFSARLTDPFHVFFDKGIYAQVGRSVYANQANFPLVWLVMPYTTTQGKFNIAEKVIAELMIAMPTEAKYTQQEREDISFKPRLLPIYEKLMEEIGKEQSFSFPPGRIEHNYRIRPYWGQGDVNSGGDTDNLFKKQIDAISIYGLKLSIRNKKCTALSLK